jgi:hypothetical protein
VIGFTDPAHAQQIAYADNGLIYESDIKLPVKTWITTSPGPSRCSSTRTRSLP